MIHAETHQALMDLRWQQDTFQLIREYLVLVHGEVLISSLSKSSKETFPNEHGDLVLEDRLEEVPGGSRISSIGRPSRSILRPLAQLRSPWPRSDASAGFTLLVIRIVTGRRHQIRVQLAGRGHPVVGDARYGNPEDAQICSRLFLHRHRLSFWSGDELISVTEPLPEDLVELLHTLEVSDQMDPIDLSDLSKDMVTLPSLCSKELLRPEENVTCFDSVTLTLQVNLDAENSAEIASHSSQDHSRPSKVLATQGIFREAWKLNKKHI